MRKNLKTLILLFIIFKQANSKEEEFYFIDTPNGKVKASNRKIEKDLKKLFNEKDCKNCNLSNEKFALKDKTFQGYTIEKSNFEGSDISGTIFTGGWIRESNFKKANAFKTQFNQTQASKSDFSESNLTDAIFRVCQLDNTKFIKSILTRTNFYDTRLAAMNDNDFGDIGANFTKAKFDNTIFVRADLYKANLFDSTGNYIITEAYDYQPSNYTNFCCTKMPDGSIKTDTANYKCDPIRQNACRDFQFK